MLQALAYNDESRTSNPKKTPINWQTSLSNLPFENAGTQPVPLDPGATKTVIDGTRTLTLDNTTAFSLAASSLGTTRYRITFTGGTNPGFRTDRGLTLNTNTLTLTVNPNLTVTVAAGTGTPFSALQVGDTAFIPGTSTGDAAGPFSSLNEGTWTVLTGGASTIVIARAAGTVFSGTTESVTLSNNTSFIAFASAGVQAGDTLYLSSGFAPSALGAYEILAVTSTWIEFQSILPLGPQTGVEPGTAGFSIFTSSKRFLLIETDQEICVQLNGGTDFTNVISPVIAGHPRFQGVFVKLGPVWKLVVVNQSSAPANVTVASAE